MLAMILRFIPYIGAVISAVSSLAHLGEEPFGIERELSFGFHSRPSLS
jgi:hypothetical protein